MSFIFKKTIFIKILLVLFIFCNTFTTNINSTSAIDKAINSISVKPLKKDKMSSPLSSIESKIDAAVSPQKCAIKPLTTSTQKPFAIGIDVSKWQGNIDWKTVAKSGVQFAMIKTSSGILNSEKKYIPDKQLEQNIKGAKSAGIPIGAYHYLYATTVDQAKNEAEFFIEQLKKSKWEYPVCLDIEDKKQKALSKELCTDIALTFLDRVSKAGYYTSIYTYSDFTKSHLNMKKLKNYDLWVAQWSDTYKCELPYGMWQYTAKGSVPGIYGDVDLDYAYKDYPKIIKSAHLNGF